MPVSNSSPCRIRRNSQTGCGIAYPRHPVPQLRPSPNVAINPSTPVAAGSEDAGSGPEAIDTVLINRPDLPPADADQSSIRPVAPALANAVFDATGVRRRRAPLTPQRLKPALG
jgi:hypothetical protein